MNHQKRTLASAMRMTAEQAAFIRGSGEANSPVPPIDNRAEKDQSEPFVDSNTVEMSVDRTRPARRIESTRGRGRRQHQIEPIHRKRALRMPITTRLLPESVERLKRLCLERRLAGHEPSTLQEIMDIAIEAWLHQNPE